MKEFCEKTVLFGYSIEARCNLLDAGIHVLLTGGCRTHVGSVSYAFPGEAVETIQFPAHREGTVSAFWAESLCRKCGQPAVVSCGIHYDGVSREEITEIVEETRRLLSRVEARLEEA